MSTPPAVAQKRAAFRRLHESGCFVLPNPWDIGSARYLQHVGFKALATTSSGYAWTLGRPDTSVQRDEVLAHFRALAAAADVPLNGDFEHGYADEPQDVAASATLAVATGVAGLSIEDSTGKSDKPLYDLALAVERVRAARRAIGDSGVVLTARAEGYLVGRPHVGEAIQRLTAYAEAGADCLYAPGIRTREDIVAIVKAVAPKPVNVLVGAPVWTVADLAALGVRRISVGGALARAAWGEAIRAATELANQGTFGGFSRAIPFAEIDGFFAGDWKK